VGVCCCSGSSAPFGCGLLGFSSCLCFWCHLLFAYTVDAAIIWDVMTYTLKTMVWLNSEEELLVCVLVNSCILRAVAEQQS